MRNSAMGVDLEFLRGFLEEEFSTVPGARILLQLPAGTQRSIDLQQDYDAEANDLHVRRGVRVLIGSREYFFPATWVSNRQMDLVYRLVEEVRGYLGK